MDGRQVGLVGRDVFDLGDAVAASGGRSRLVVLNGRSGRLVTTDVISDGGGWQPGTPGFPNPGPFPPGGQQGGAVQIAPVARLDLLLYDADGRFRGVLGRVRDLLTGSYSFGITGRDATSVRLPPGSYQVRLVAWPTEDGTGAPSRAHVSFHIE